jgi:hypothetical protein
MTQSGHALLRCMNPVLTKADIIVFSFIRSDVSQFQ